MGNFILIILDSLGIGELPDASEYGDIGADTLGHITTTLDNINLPNLEALGLGKIKPLNGINANLKTKGAFGKLASSSKGKDTTVGHWELMGIILDAPFATFPNGFPDSFINSLTKTSGHKFLGNYASSGTEIIKSLGPKHIETKDPIIYTSSDSVCQIAAHEDIIPLQELYTLCEHARTFSDSNAIARVIARPFIGENGYFTRTKNRKDFSIMPPKDTALNLLLKHKIQTVGIGKIDDIFASSGLSRKIHSKGNPDCIDTTIKEIIKNTNSFIFTNLVDMDMLYGHRRDPQGYYNSIKDFDEELPEIINSLSDQDLLVITADHGNDPCFKGTDHTREYVPLLVYSKKMDSSFNLGTGKTFADVGKSLLNFFDISDSQSNLPGKSFLTKIF